MILQGDVSVNGQVITKSSTLIEDCDLVQLKDTKQYVSRSAHKLLQALDSFSLQLHGGIVLDVGASTGGFTQVCLERGASFVVGIDVGYGQMVESLRVNPKVKVYEGINAREPLPFSTLFDFIVMDVSFISVLKIIPNLMSHMDVQTKFVLLIKPQFEQKETRLQILPKKLSEDLALQVLESLRQLPLRCSELVPTTLKGKDGNQEYLVLLSLQH
jgi:23S rRNA (cytidine1920-2'-O)/16S rRNA (cytidine1409-2'-O)-methyltransferase